MASKWLYAAVILSLILLAMGTYTILSMPSTEAALSTTAGQWCTNGGGMSSRWCSTGMALTSCRDGCTRYNSVNSCSRTSGANWVANCQAGCTVTSGCNAAY